MNCPHCHKPIDASAIIAEHARKAASAPRPNARGIVRNKLGNPNLRNPWGRKGKPKPATPSA